MFYASCRFICKVFFHSYLKTKIVGVGNIPLKGGFILAGNHVSYLDPIALGIACPRQLHYMARDTLFRNSVFGWILLHVNAIPLKRNFADIGAIKGALKLLKKGEGLLLFPEGTRSADGSLSAPHEGVGFLARKSVVPVIPVYAQGTNEALAKDEKFIKRGAINVIFGEPVIFQEDKSFDDRQATEEIMRRIAALKDTGILP